MRVEDISRNRLVGMQSIRPEPVTQQRSHRQIDLELCVAAELLRTTPRFWNTVTMRVKARDAFTIHLGNTDGFPFYASVSSRLRIAVAQLYETMETEADLGWTDVFFNIAWTSPRTWAFDAFYIYSE